ncbi:MAG TPA: bifunctional isocitrate dehydrogenase kinase/phosphatase [Chloroflexia bacterium]|nr:bifunctional isocitrate dehydrogenase kinase/phosphatase [Chloroflexia bacterium]
MVPKNITTSRLANLGAQAIYEAFDTFQRQFKTITGQAKQRFENREWAGALADASERLELYKKIVDRLKLDMLELLDGRTDDKLVWASIKAVYSGLIENREDWEIAETFFNSVTRQIFTTVGVDEQIEFVDTDFEVPPTEACSPVYREYNQPSSCEGLVKNILEDYRFQVPYQNLEQDVALVSRAIEERLTELKSSTPLRKAEIIKTIFYRGKGAYIVGRLFAGRELIPLGLALLNTPEGVIVDAVVLNDDDLGIIFSFTRSYFRVEVDRPYDMVRFLKTLMPRKRIAELYISIGYNKHGKTALYRDLLHQLVESDDQFEIAPGERGMVMVVFTLPSFDVVFKLIKDRFTYPKNTTRKAVMEQYHMVFQHDRAGRLVDAQEFEHLKFERSRFSEKLLEELQQVAAQTVTVQDDEVIIRHCYVERRVTPLNLYVKEADEDSATAAVIDCGNAIKDLAGINIFTGDMLLKNFGVTRHGRVVFYDYDELCSITGCKFRELPQAENDADALAAEPWYSVGENDVFPEEFKFFLGLQGKLREVFFEHHSELFEVTFWRQIQERLQAGEIIDIFPYGLSKRLHLCRIENGKPTFPVSRFAATFNTIP